MSEENGLDAETFDLTLLANFVHQIVNPLNGVAGTLDNLEKGLIKEEFRRQQRLGAARAQIEQCITLLRNLAYLTQGMQKLSDSDKKIVVLPQVIIESAMFFQEDAENKKIKIFLKDKSTQNRVSAHPDLVRQVLMNVFDNYTKYGMPNSTVEVEQWIQSTTSNAMIRIRGISRYPLGAADTEKIFHLGYRGGNAKQVVASGTGLGLYICRKIIESHGGDIRAQEFGANGVEFTIKIPGGEAEIG